MVITDNFWELILMPGSNSYAWKPRTRLRCFKSSVDLQVDPMLTKGGFWRKLVEKSRPQVHNSHSPFLQGPISFPTCCTYLCIFLQSQLYIMGTGNPLLHSLLYHPHLGSLFLLLVWLPPGCPPAWWHLPIILWWMLPWVTSIPSHIGAFQQTC